MPRWIHDRARRILVDNPDMEEGLAFALSTQQSHALDKSPKDYGTTEGREKAKQKYKDPKAMKKTAFVEALPTLAGLTTGYSPGRSIAGETAAAMAPEGRVHRSENLARNAAVIGAPLGGLIAMGLARKYRLPSRVGNMVSKNFPEGIIAEPEIEQELIRLGIPGVAAIGGSLAGGGATGAAVGGVQQLRGPVHHRRKEAALKPNPMWGTIGGAARQPAWRAQAGFTPTGMSTPAQKLQKSMGMGKFDSSKGLKPLDLGKMQQQAQTAAAGGGVKMGHVLVTLMKIAEEEAEKKRPHVEGANALGWGGLGVNLVGGASTQLAGMSALKGAQEEAAASGASELSGKVRATSPVPVHSGHGVQGGFFVPGGGGKLSRQVHNQMSVDPMSKTQVNSPHILTPKGTGAPSILAHEIGHADIDANRFGRLVQNRGTMMMGNLRNPLALGIGAATGGSDDERVRNAGLIGSGLLSAPQLLYEGAANVMGYRKLKGLGASPAQLQAARRTLLPAFGSYLGAAVGGVGSAMTGSGIARGIANQDRAEPVEAKTAAEVPAKNEREDAEVGDEVEPELAKAAEEDGGHGGFSTNQYSGQMNPARLPYASGIPSWREPAVKTLGPEKTAAGLTPMGRLNSARLVGAPKVGPAPGPSIAQIAKPKGFGTPMSGAKKGNNII